MFKYIGRRGATGRKRKLTGLVALALSCTLAVGVYAFTASNTVEAHSAGAGVGVVSGYTISSPTNYIFSGTGETMIGVTFELDKAATDVQVALTPGTPATANWSDCGASVGVTVTCTFAAPVPVAQGTHLSVAAVSSGTVTIE